MLFYRYIMYDIIVILVSFLSSSSFFYRSYDHHDLLSFPTRRASVLRTAGVRHFSSPDHSHGGMVRVCTPFVGGSLAAITGKRSEEHTSELQSHSDLVCRLLLEKKT